MTIDFWDRFKALLNQRLRKQNKYGYGSWKLCTLTQDHSDFHIKKVQKNFDLFGKGGQMPLINRQTKIDKKTSKLLLLKYRLEFTKVALSFVLLCSAVFYFLLCCFLNLWLRKGLNRCQKSIVKFRHFLCWYMI